ncbi:hypothetical protein TNIN_393441 [Trichonephila inaurata madagascariensis]|uniref:Uncharacterized protein n=1 Tax=Trichonephila inaurata madagascariensis TaxID=2747483 RepID=A0A8X6YXE7_9ARAC|nr:hypothetical protein TNIN_393441 [Trichonephila inaurata madagascariensis]
MIEKATKEDLVTVLHEIGETVDSDLGILELKQKLLLCKTYLADEEFVCSFLDTTIEDRMEKEECRKKIDQYRKKEEEYRKGIEEHRKRAEERRLEREQELEFSRIEARRKTENETRIREARHKEETEARLKAEVEARLKAEVEARLKAEEEAKAVEEGWKKKEE